MLFIYFRLIWFYIYIIIKIKENIVCIKVNLKKKQFR